MPPVVKFGTIMVFSTARPSSLINASSECNYDHLLDINNNWSIPELILSTTWWSTVKLSVNRPDEILYLPMQAHLSRSFRTPQLVLASCCRENVKLTLSICCCFLFFPVQPKQTSSEQSTNSSHSQIKNSGMEKTTLLKI